MIDDWHLVVEKYNGDGNSRLVIIDDGSMDNTYKIMQEYAESRPLFQLITKPNVGHGATVLYGYKYALENGADYIFQTDSDGQTLLEEFYRFWDIKDDYDMVIGNRNKHEDGFSRVVVTKTLKLVIRLCFGVKVIEPIRHRLMKAERLNEAVKDFKVINKAIK